MLSRRGVGAALLSVVLVSAALLTGCSGGSDPSTTPASQDPGRPLQTVSADGLPADYPRDEIPVIAGEVTSFQKSGGKDPGYAIAVVTDDAAPAAMSKAVSLLEDAGWTQKSESNGGQIVVLSKGTDLAILTTNPTGDRTLVGYAIDTSA